jgi:hypothetical protein
MIYYHITDDFVVDKILREGLKGDPVVYLAKRPENCLAIRRCQIRNKEHFGSATLLEVNLPDHIDLWYDSHCFQPESEDLAWMVYSDIAPEFIRIVYS